MGGFLAFASLHAQDVGLLRTSLPLAVYGVVVVVCRVAFAKVPDRLPPLPLGAAALVAIAAGMALAAAWATPPGSSSLRSSWGWGSRPPVAARRQRPARRRPSARSGSPSA